MPPPSAGTHVPYQKCLGHLCPSGPNILGTPLKSAHVFIFQRGGVRGKCPLPRPRAPMFPTRKCLGLLCPSGTKLLATPLQSTVPVFKRGHTIIT